MKLGTKVAAIAGLLFVGMLVLNQGLRLLNQANDVAVLGGVAILLGLVVVGVAAGRVCLRQFGVFFVVGGMVLATGCNKVIEPGHVGILVNQSGSDRGVQDFPIKTGRVFYNPWTERVYEYPTFVQTAKWTKDVHEGNPINEEITFTNKDQMLISADISLSYSLRPDRIPAFYVKFRSDKIESFTHGFLRNTARDMFNETAGKYTIEQVMGDNGPFLAEVREKLQRAVEPVGVQLEQFGLIGAPRPPQQVIDSINMKAQAIQNALRVENEIRQSEAEAKKRIAQAEGEARANQILASSITQNLVTWRQLDLQGQALGKWNGALPTYTGGNGPIPFLSVQK